MGAGQAVGRPVPEPADGLDAARDEHVALAGLDRVRGHADRLQRRRAVAVHGGAGRLVEAREEGDDPRHVVSGLAGRLRGAPDHVLHLGGIEPGNLGQERLDDVGAEVVGATLDQRALARSADRRACSGNDDGFHGSPPGCSGQTLAVSVAGILLLSFVGGSVPFSNIAARFVSGVDLREFGGGTVSGTALYRVAGFWPLAVAGILDVTKGAVGPLLAGDRTAVAAVAGGLAVVGHNWSPFLRGAGGRGVAPALGALLVTAWPGAVLLLVGLLAGKFFRNTGMGGFVAELALTPVLAIWGGASRRARGPLHRAAHAA